MKYNRNYEEVCCDFTELGESSNKFFRLGDYLAEVPNRRLGKRKKMHKFGVLSLLFKHKVLVAIENGEVALWEDVKFRPIISFFNNIYKSWYTHAGRAIMLMAKIYYWRSDTVTNMREVMAKVRRMNKKFAGEDLV